MSKISESVQELQIQVARKDERINQLEKKMDEKTEKMEDMKRLLYNLEGKLNNIRSKDCIDIEQEDVDGPVQTLAKLGTQGKLEAEFERNNSSAALLQQPRTKLQDVLMKSTFGEDESECIIQAGADFNTRREELRPPSVNSSLGLGGIVQMGRFHSQLTGKNTTSWQSSCLPTPQLPDAKASMTN